MKKIFRFMLVMAMLIWFGDIKHVGDGDSCFVLVMHPKKGAGPQQKHEIVRATKKVKVGLKKTRPAGRSSFFKAPPLKNSTGRSVEFEMGAR